MSKSGKRKELPMINEDCGKYDCSGNHSDRHLNILVAKQAKKGGRYGDVVKAMETTASEHGAPLSKKETELLELGYNKVIASERSFWRFMKSIVQNAESEGNQTKVDVIKVYMHSLEENINQVCLRAETILKDLVREPDLVLNLDLVTYHKMLGDHFRFRAGFKIGMERENLARQALENYEEATRSIVKETLIDSFESRYRCLSLYLNHSVLHYEIFNSLEGGHRIAREAIDKATHYMKGEIPGGEWDSRGVRLVEILNENFYVAVQNDAGRARGEKTVYLKDSLDV